jgi:hypothetical protein
VAVNDAVSLWSALAATATLYQRLRDEAAPTLPEPLIRRDAAERAALAYAAEIGAATQQSRPPGKV